MNLKAFNLLLVFLISSVSVNFLKASDWDMYSIDKHVFVGSIMFPKAIKSLPPISLYRIGLKIKTENEGSKKKIQFTISEDKACRTFYLLIAEKIIPDIEENTVKYLKIDTTKDYKLYELNLFTTRDIITNPVTKREEIKETASWNIKNIKIDSDGIIRDDALIMIFNPNYIEKLEGGNNFELPKIIIKKNILQLAGSESKLQDEVNLFQLSALDLGILHSSPTSKVMPECSNKKIKIAMLSVG